MRRRILSLILAAMMSAAAIGTGAPAAAEEDAAHEARISLYMTFLEAEGRAQQVRDLVAGVKAHTAAIVAGEVFQTETLPPEQQKIFEDIAAPIFATAEKEILFYMADKQSATLTQADIQALIDLNQQPLVKKYAAMKQSLPDNSKQVETLMVDSVVDLVGSFQENRPLPPAVMPDRPIDRLLKAEGMAAGTRSTIAASMMPMIVQEVGQYIDLPALTQTDRGRMHAMIEIEKERLAQNILQLTAQALTALLSEAEINALLAAYDIPAQHKLTAARTKEGPGLDALVEGILSDAMDTAYIDYML